MPEFVTAGQAVSRIPSGAVVWSNAFLALANPWELQCALGRRVQAEGKPDNLTFCCTAGFGDWQPGSPNEEFVRRGAVRSVVLGHFSSTPDTARMVMEGNIEGYNLPLGVLSKMVRAAAGGEKYYVSDIGLNLFADPARKEYQLNGISREEYVGEIFEDGKRRLRYRIPPMDVALIKGSSADRYGNISFEKEPTVSDALSLAQAVKAQGGLVLVQVERVREEPKHPREIVVPAPLVDCIAVCEGQTQMAGSREFSPAYAGDVHFSQEELQTHVLQAAPENPARALVARRAAQELQQGDFVNIGIGIPEGVAAQAARNGMLDTITLTVESGSMGGVPAPGTAFGASTGAQILLPMAQQFDFYDGGGLDICFLGALEIDGAGNVNSHCGNHKLSGIGGFANISQTSPKVVFCATFTVGGLSLEEKNGELCIHKEGRHAKFVKKVQSVSFSAQNARQTGQEVLYITERCVFRLGPQGLELAEVSPGVDVRRDILRQLPFPVVWKGESTVDA